ncbi:MAG: GAF domain-containing sensor histidine kinase [Moorea sp. SIO3C2]|nr:GAF domain-containing sensor histidine kinase [Moorena sp. SIO3C2]
MENGLVMAKENQLFCTLDGLTPKEREKKRLKTLRDLGLLEAETVPVFDEATQTTARFLDVPICILGFMVQTQQHIKSAVGLSRIGLMNRVAQSRQLPRSECFCSYVVDSHQMLAINDTVANPVFASSVLVHHYGIRSYLGAPLLTADGECLGTLAVMDLVPRNFTTKDYEFLAITARWSLSEFERNHFLKKERDRFVNWLPNSSTEAQHSQEVESDRETSSPRNFSLDGITGFNSVHTIKYKLLTQLTQELRTPLTSIMGMASVLSRQVYGSLTDKQKEYLEIVYCSGRQLVLMVDEILCLGIFEENSEQLNLTAVDIEMLCQQAMNNLSQIAQQHRQKLHLSVEPGNRIWFLDKEKVRQMLYYLIFSVIYSAEAGGEVRIHVSRKTDLERANVVSLKIAVWVSHPWLGDGLPQMYGQISELPLQSPSAAAAVANALETPFITEPLGISELPSSSNFLCDNQFLSSSFEPETSSWDSESEKTPQNSESRESLGLLLSCHLAKRHRGKISVEGLPELGYRYVITLPKLESSDQNC